MMATKYLIFNPGPNVAKEFKPGIGTFEIGPGKSIEVTDEQLAKSLVEDSNGRLQMTKVDK